MFARIEIAMRPEFTDPAATAILRKIELAHPQLRKRIRWGRSLEVYWLDLPSTREDLIPAITEIFWDKVLKWLFTGNLIPAAAGKQGGVLDLMEAAPHRPGKFWALERRLRAGVTDNMGKTALEAFEIVLGQKLEGGRAASGSFFLLEGPELDEDALSVIARDILCNELIETWTLLPEHELKKNDRFHQERIKRDMPRVPSRGSDQTEPVRLGPLGDSELEALSKKRLWALSLAEMQSIRLHFDKPEEKERRLALGLDDPTDVEMEVLAQTWSEHCKHKIFNARIRYESDDPAGSETAAIPGEIDGLFRTTISSTTAQIPKSWLLSVFEDNAGIVGFDEEDAICIKVETHNSPSALDPYGGALTGIVGVNRDILGCGLGAKPLFNTNVFCLAPPDYAKPLPERLLHPRRILDGVRLGVEHGGNKSGIPTVNGALVFDERFLGKPLIYCGTGGIMPRMSAGNRCEVKTIVPGDRICMVGGRVGKDGIHGATFSSMALDDLSPSSAVQLGDPITQKRVADFLIEARDMGLYRAITDNGAGGLSSSVGELARLSGGARMDVSLAKTKYPGLKPYELVVSESQERMTLAVPPERLGLFLALADRRGVEVSDLGEFNDSGCFDIFYGPKRVASLDLEFLHGGVPRMEIQARWEQPGQVDTTGAEVPLFESEGSRTLLHLLGRPNIASKEWLIRQYDHEVQGTSVVKPLHLVGAGTQAAWSGPNDGAVLKPKANSEVGLAVACGINTKLSDIDPYLMAQSAVDEAVRNLLCVGAEYGHPESVLALVDNFCWPDPVSDPVKAGWLVRACYGLRNAALALSVPLVSGKDSMKNDYRGRLGEEDIQISVPPTLLMTAVGRVPDIRQARTADFKNIGDLIYVVGASSLSLTGTEFAQAFPQWSSLFSQGPQGSGVAGGPNWEEALRIYGWIGGGSGKEHVRLRSLHDISEGGILVSIAESLLARSYGATLTFPKDVQPWEFAFGEGFHGFIASLAEGDATAIEAEWYHLGIPFRRLGTVTAQEKLEVCFGGAGATSKVWNVSTRALRGAWLKEGYWE